MHAQPSRGGREGRTVAKVKTSDGTLHACDFGTADSMMDKIREAKKKGEEFIKCGGVWIRISTITVVTDRVAPPDESDEGGWPSHVTINIGGARRMRPTEIPDSEE